jgi:hypothetical protein
MVNLDDDPIDATDVEPPSLWNGPHANLPDAGLTDATLLDYDRVSGSLHRKSW